MGRFSAWLALAAAFFASVLLVACSSSEAPPIPNVRAAEAVRDVVDGEARLSSTVTIEFDRDFEIAEGRVPLASRFEFDVPDLVSATGRKRVLVREAERQPPDGRTIILYVDALIPEDSQLKVSKSAFRRNEPGEILYPVTSDLDASTAALAALPFATARTELFAPVGEPPPPTDADRDPAVQREALLAHMLLRDPSGALAERALALYDAIPTDIVPSPKLRAAFAGLIGTFAEPAIDDLLTEDNCTGRPSNRIVFAAPPDEADLFARVTFEPDGTRVVSISPVLEAERFELLMPVLAHEAVHCDYEDGRFEEIAATAFDTLLWIQLVTLDPSLINGVTALSRELNVDAIAMFNSGRRLPESLGLLPSPGVEQALPLTTAGQRSFADLVATAYERLPNDSPEEPLARKYVEILASAAGHDEGRAFNLLYLDELFGRVATPGLISALIEIYELVPVG